MCCVLKKGSDVRGSCSRANSAPSVPLLNTGGGGDY